MCVCVCVCVCVGDGEGALLSNIHVQVYRYALTYMVRRRQSLLILALGWYNHRWDILWKKYCPDPTGGSPLSVYRIKHTVTV